MVDRRYAAAFVAVLGVSVLAGLALVRRTDAPAPLSVPSIEVQDVADGGELSPNSGDEGFSFSPLRKLDEVHTRMVREGLPLLRVRIATPPVIDDADSSLLIETLAVIWAPDNAVVPTSEARQVSPQQVGDDDLAALAEVASGSEALAVVTDTGELVALAALKDGELALPAGNPDGPLFLAGAANELFELRYDPVPASSSCLPPEEAAPRIYESPLDALVTYFEALGSRPLSDRQVAEKELELIAEEVVKAHAGLVDPVTGEPVAPSMNDLEHQLRSGVPVEDLQIRPAIPVGMVVPSETLNDAGSSVAVFISARSGRVLGFAPMAPFLSIEYDGRTVPITDRVIEISPPDAEDDLVVYLRDLNAPNFTCAPTSSEEPFLVVPFDAYAGSARVVIVVESRSYIPMDASDA